MNYQAVMERATGRIVERNLTILRIHLSFGSMTYRPQGIHKIAHNALQVVFKSKRYLCIAWPAEWQHEEAL